MITPTQYDILIDSVPSAIVTIEIAYPLMQTKHAHILVYDFVGKDKLAVDGVRDIPYSVDMSDELIVRLVIETMKTNFKESEITYQLRTE